MVTLNRKKSTNSNEWQLMLDGNSVGNAKADYITPTQRVWTATATINGTTKTVTGAASIKKAITELEAQFNTTKSGVTA